MAKSETPTKPTGQQSGNTRQASQTRTTTRTTGKSLPKPNGTIKPKGSISHKFPLEVKAHIYACAVRNSPTTKRQPLGVLTYKNEIGGNRDRYTIGFDTERDAVVIRHQTGGVDQSAAKETIRIHEIAYANSMSTVRSCKSNLDAHDRRLQQRIEELAHRKEEMHPTAFKAAEDGRERLKARLAEAEEKANFHMREVETAKAQLEDVEINEYVIPVDYLRRSLPCLGT